MWCKIKLLHEYHILTKKIQQSSRVLVLLILILLPIDWFAPTGLILREAGAKPLNVLLLIILSWLLLRRGTRVFLARSRLPVQITFALIIFCGTVSFFLTMLILPPVSLSSRSPLLQFISQTAMLLLFMSSLQTLIYLFSKTDWRKKVLDMIPIAALFHCCVYLLEAAGVFSGDSSGVLALFRNEQGLIDRPSGLMSEPSYYGTFAALYAIPLMLLDKRSVFKYLLGLALLISALLIQAKTMFLVIGAQFAYLLFIKNKPPHLRFMLWMFLLGVIPTSLFMIMNTGALNLEENLSSINRLGSSILAWNLTLDGYGLFGVGIGQFHFYFLPNYAPDFLFLSQEALDQMSGVSEWRASTFNLPLRLLVETGIVGLLLYVGLMFAAVYLARRSTDVATHIGMCFVFGSLGFLMTQDSYCLPSLAFGLAMAMTIPHITTPPNIHESSNL